MGHRSAPSTAAAASNAAESSGRDGGSFKPPFLVIYAFCSLFLWCGVLMHTGGTRAVGPFLRLEFLRQDLRELAAWTSGTAVHAEDGFLASRSRENEYRCRFSVCLLRALLRSSFPFSAATVAGDR